MIVPMVQVTLFVSARDKEESIKLLRRLGVLHIHYTKPPTSESVSNIEREISLVDKALNILKPLNPAKAIDKLEESEALQLTHQILELSEKRQNLLTQLETEKEKLAWYQRWGKVSRDDLATLRAHNIYVRLYVADRNFLKKVQPSLPIYIVGEEPGKLYLALISDDPELKLELKEELPPLDHYAIVEEQVHNLTNAILKIDQSLQDLAQYKNALQNYLATLKRNLEFARVQAGMNDLEAISYITGFCPEDKVNELKKMANKAGWGYLFQEPDNPAIVPTLIRRPKWLEIVSPIFKFMGTVPGYNEYDISFVFLCFFSLFFAILIGDAGYGLIFLLLGILLRKKYKKAPREPFILLYVLSTALIIWGSITGNWFGMEGIARLPLLNSLIIEKMNTWSKDSDKVTQFIMHLTFLIGAIHLSIGHFINGAKKFPHLSFLAQVGWILVVWFMYFLANNLVLSKSLPGFAIYFLAGGALLILFFDNYSKGKFWRGIASSIGNLPLSIIGAFGDVVSYLRLFAVGLAGSVVEISFNNMALGSLDSLVKIIVAIIVLLFGHALNIALCAMSVVVHGIRLNMLEFSNHLGMTWSGFEYRPFKE